MKGRALTAAGLALAAGAALASTGSASIAASAASSAPATSSQASAPHGPAVFAAGGQVWSGYVDVAHANVKLRYVASNFNVPDITCNGANSKASFWVGLDGFGNGTVEQDGLSTDCASPVGGGGGGAADYRVWYEMFPKGTVYWPFHPRVGDQIAAAVYFDYSTGVYSLSITDKNTPSASFNVTQRCPSGSTCQNTTAEAVLEAANGTDLSRFTPAVSFTDSAVTSRDGTHGTFGNAYLWNLAEPVMTGSNGQPLANISGLSNGGRNFAISYHEAR